MTEMKTIRESAERSRGLWINVFDNLVHAMLDYEMRPEEARKRIVLCADLADSALEEIESRWPNQPTPEERNERWSRIISIAQVCIGVASLLFFAYFVWAK